MEQGKLSAGQTFPPYQFNRVSTPHLIKRDGTLTTRKGYSILKFYVLIVPLSIKNKIRAIVVIVTLLKAKQIH